MPGYSTGVRCEKIFMREPLGCEVSPQIAVDDIDISKCPKVIPIEVFRMDSAKRRFDVTQLVR